jgi:FtsH-binding integral membrane protein
MADFESQTLQGRAGAKTQAIPSDPGLRSFLLGIYQKMALGLVVTGAMAWAVANSPILIEMLYRITPDGHIAGYTLLGYVFLFAPVALSLASNIFMRNLNVAMMALFYWIFVAVMGVSLSSVVLLYTGVSLTSTFFITAGTFAAVSLFGYTTKRDISGWRAFLIMAVFGILIASLLNVFLLHSSVLSMAVSAIGVLVFSGLIAVKTQGLKQVYYQLEGSFTGRAAMTYYGALTLYISFINLFLSILRFTGGRR